MDDHVTDTLAFVPDRRWTAVSAAGFLIALVLALGTGDREGRLLAVVAAAVLGISAACDLLFSPRLQVGTDGVVIRSPFTRAALAWPEITSIRLVERRRLGLRSQSLEVDAGDVLEEFTRRGLGTDLDEALTRILALRPA